MNWQENVTRANVTTTEVGWWGSVPQSEELISELRWAWPLHTYGLACLFSLLGCATFFTILGLRAQLSSRPYLSSLNVFLCLLAASRALGLFLDPYGAKKLLPPVMLALLWDLAFPCLLSAFSLLQLSLLRGVEGIAPPKLSSETCLTLVITCHFCLVLAANILWTVQSSLRVLWLTTQMVFASWGLFLCACFLLGCARALRDTARIQETLKTGFQDKGVFLGLHVGGLPPVSMAVPTGSSRDPCSTPNCTTMSSSLATTAGSQDPQPKIRITDENEQTYSYASENSQHMTKDPLDSTPGSPIMATPPCRRGSSNRRPRIDERQWAKRNDCSPDPSQFSPLMGPEDMSVLSSCVLPSPVLEPYGGDHQSAILAVNHPSTPGARFLTKMAHSKLARLHYQQSGIDEFKFDAQKLRPGGSSRSSLEKLLRRLLVASCMGALLCIFQVYEVLGPHGLLAAKGHKTAVLPWFAYQTAYRLLEFSMGCAMGRLTRQSLVSCGFHHGHSHPYSAGLKYRESLFS